MSVRAFRCMISCLCVRRSYIGEYSLHFHGTRSPNNVHDVIFSKPEFSLHKYTVTWPPVRVHLCSICCSEHPGYSQCAHCQSRKEKVVSSSHKQEGELQRCATLAPSSHSPIDSPVFVTCKKLHFRKFNIEQSERSHPVVLYQYNSILVSL